MEITHRRQESIHKQAHLHALVQKQGQGLTDTKNQI